MREFTGKCRRPRPPTTLCASLQPLYGRIYRKNARAVGACAIEMQHLGISQEPFCARIYRKNAGPHGRNPHFGEPGQWKCTLAMSPEPRKFAGKMPQTKTTAQTLCEPAQSKCTWTCHKSHFVRKFTGKMPQTSWSTLIKHQPLLLP